MVDFPILEEIKNFIYTNLETIFLVIVPFATLIGWLAERHNKRLIAIEEASSKLISDLKMEIANRDKDLEEHIKEYNEFRIKVEKQLAIIKALFMKDYDTDPDDIDIDRDFNKNIKRKRRSNS